MASSGKHFRSFLLLAVVLGTGCQTARPPEIASRAITLLHFDPKNLSFQDPRTGNIFTLHLGEDLADTGGSTPAPLRDTMRNATSSHYEPMDKDGAGYAAAESQYTRDQYDLVIRNTTIQYQSDSGRILITEDLSDGRPCVRFILYSPSGRGYKVTYLQPGYEKFRPDRLYWRPAGIELLPGDRAKILNKVIRVDDIPGSVHPFSVGG